MRVALQIFKRDLKRILTNPVAVVIMLGVAIIPSLYAWFNILANWDPYENTSTVPIAVVIEDQGAEVGDIGFTNAGDLIREQLEQNTQLGWTFTSEDEALEGVRAGEYYAAFVVPSDFTASLADVLDGDTQQAHIGYYVNEKVNAVSPKVTDTGATTLELQIEQQFVNVVGQTVTTKLKDATGNVVSAIDDATSAISTDLRDASSTVDGLATTLEGTVSTIDAAREATSQATDTLRQLSGTSASLAGTLNDALGTLGDTRAKAQTLTAKLGGAIGGAGSTIAGISSTASYDIGQLTGDIGWAQGKLDAAIQQIRALNGTVQTLKGTLESTRTTIASITLPNGQSFSGSTEITNQLDDEISVLVQLSDAQLARLDELERLSDSIKTGNDAVRNLSSTVNDAIQNSTKGLSQLQESLSANTLPQLSGALDSFSSAGGRVSGMVGSVAPMLDQATSTLGQLDAVLAQAKDTVASTAGSLHGSAQTVSKLADDTAALSSAATLSGIEDLLSLDGDTVGDFLGSPVEIADETVFAVKNYGSGVAPFYTNLALWVGGFVLVAIYKLEVDKEGVGDFKPWQGFFGRWLLLNLIGQLQAIICCVGDIALGIQCLSPVAYVFAGMVESFVYVFFIYAISVAFRHIGKALGVLLVILQIPGTSGVYPIEMMPGFFQALHPWLPFTYGINAMREAVAGFYGTQYAQNLLVLLVYLVPSLLLGITARRHLLNINALFDRRLADTDFMITERYSLKGSTFNLATIVKVMLDSDSYSRVFLERAASFELRYPTLVRHGFMALIWVPLALLAIMFVVPAKMPLLALWIISLIVICGYLITLEYLHTRVTQKTELASMSRDELYDLLDDELRQQFMAFAPIEKMRLDRKAKGLDSTLAMFRGAHLAGGQGDAGGPARDTSTADETVSHDKTNPKAPKGGDE